MTADVNEDMHVRQRPETSERVFRAHGLTKALGLLLGPSHELIGAHLLLAQSDYPAETEH
jgi:hypothetical protein